MIAGTNFSQITCFVFDMDGVLTDGTLLLLPDNTQVRKMHIKDGYAIQLAVKKGYKIHVISGSHAEPVRVRLNKLGVTDVSMSVRDKKEHLLSYMKSQGIKKEELLYMGDDIPDLDAMQLAGLPCCPSDAAVEIRSVSSFVSSLAGGTGCVREVIEKVMRARGDWQALEGVSSL